MPNKIKTQTFADTTWIDIEHPSSEQLQKLEQDYNLHPVHLSESVQKVQHNQIEREENYLFLVLHIPVADPARDKINVSQIGIFLGKDFLITIRIGDSPVVTDLFALCAQHPQESNQYFEQGVAYLLYCLIGKVLDDISVMTDAVLSELDEIEELVFDNNKSDAQRIGKSRQKIVRLSRLIGPKRFVLQDLTEQIDSFSGRSMSKYYSNNAKAVNKLWEVVEEAKETVEIFKDADFTTSTEKTNRILAVLTLFFTLTIPITVVGTLYGMNVPLPGGNEAGPWAFFGEYTALWLVMLTSSGAAIAMYLYFKNKKWF